MAGQSARRPRVGRATPSLLKDLRMLRVAVCHPDDADGRELTQQLQRIGCQVRHCWPPMPVLPDGLDVVFLAVRPDTIDMGYAWARREEAPTVIAVVDYENPTIVEAVLRCGAKAVLPSPVRSFGLLSTLVVARQANEEIRAHARRVRKLEAKLLGSRHIAQAKRILMDARGVTEAQAYALIREQAMSKRVTMEEVAGAIVGADEILALGKPDPAR